MLRAADRHMVTGLGLIPQQEVCVCVCVFMFHMCTLESIIPNSQFSLLNYIKKM